jgi:hypothetical protein
MQTHRFMRTFEFNHRIWMWKCCILSMLHYLNCPWNQVWMKVIQVQSISVWKYCKFSCSATETVINALISIQLTVNVINGVKFPCPARATITNVLTPVWLAWHSVSLQR